MTASTDIDPRPGFYYVSAIHGVPVGNNWWAMSGPYTTHAEALDRVDAVRRECEQLDPRSAFMAFGTMRSETDLGPGRLEKLNA